MLAFGLAGLCTGGLDRRVNDLGVPLDRDRLLCNENLITDRAVLALGLAGLCTGGLDRRVNDLGVTLGGDFLLLNENLITDRAMLALSFAGLCAGRLDCFVNDLGVRTRRFAAPNAVYIVDRSPGFRALCRGIAAVLIVQLGGGDGDILRNRFINRYASNRFALLPALMCYLFFTRCALLNIFTGTCTGMNIRTIGSGIDGSRCRQRAIDIDLRIDKIVFGAGIALTGRIRNGDKFLISCTTIAAPLLCIINIE